jgi:hypothetical protein
VAVLLCPQNAQLVFHPTKPNNLVAASKFVFLVAYYQCGCLLVPALNKLIKMRRPSGISKATCCKNSDFRNTIFSNQIIVFSVKIDQRYLDLTSQQMTNVRETNKRDCLAAVLLTMVIQCCITERISMLSSLNSVAFSHALAKSCFLRWCISKMLLVRKRIENLSCK